MKPFARFPASKAKKISVVFTDIDDTLTRDGRLEAPAYAALCKLEKSGIHVVPVTGRPAGWCDHIARMWPVTGVVGENGALYYRYDHASRTFVRRYAESDAAREQHQQKLRDLGARILRSVPGAALASDQAFRLFDLAIDFCEDVPRLSEAEISRIVELFERNGATAKVSSIHVNGWFGQYDKLSMIRRFASEVLGLDLDRAKDRARAIYVGDSPNDEPAFRFFENSVGVANVRDFEDRLAHPPTWVCKARGGRGFAEIARRLRPA
jgi:HAD superfamily hydrolase (TIGR01484 family)